MPELENNIQAPAPVLEGQESLPLNVPEEGSATVPANTEADPANVAPAENGEDKLFEMEQELKSYRDKESFFKEQESKLKLAKQIDEYLLMYPEKAQAIAGILNGKSNEQAVLPPDDGEGDPRDREIARLKMEQQQLREKQSAEQRNAELQEARAKEAQKLHTSLDDLSSRFPLLKDKFHRKNIVQEYGYTNEPLYKIVMSYDRNMRDVANKLNQEYLTSKKGEQPTLPRGGNPGGRTTQASAPFGSEEKKAEIEAYLRRNVSKT
jgi:hypothetical protein